MYVRGIAALVLNMQVIAHILVISVSGIVFDSPYFLSPFASPILNNCFESNTTMRSLYLKETLFCPPKC